MSADPTSKSRDSDPSESIDAQVSRSPSRKFTIYNKMTSVRGRMIVTDSAGEQIASAQRKLLAWRETWDVEAPEGKLRLRRKLFTLMPQWIIDGDLGEFSIRRKWALLRRRYRVHGGPFDSAALQGNFLDLRMEVTQQDMLVLKTHGYLLSLRDRHEVEIFDETPGAILFAIATMVALLADRRDKEQSED